MELSTKGSFREREREERDEKEKYIAWEGIDKMVPKGVIALGCHLQLPVMGWTG